MNNRFTYKGQVHQIGPVQTFASGFKKRELICKTTHGEYTDYAVFTVKKELTEKLASMNIGTEVSVEFALDGHEWDGPNGKRWFGGATALKIERSGAVMTTKKDESHEEAMPEDIPF